MSYRVGKIRGDGVLRPAVLLLINVSYFYTICHLFQGYFLANRRKEQRRAHINPQLILILNSLETFAPLREIKVKRKRTPQLSQALMELRRKRDNARGKNRLKFKDLRNRCVELGKTEVRENNTRRWKKIQARSGRS
jgi:hypothetical protein